jgi:hypothetical protein
MGGNQDGNKEGDQNGKDVISHTPNIAHINTNHIQKQKPKWEPPPPTRIGKKKRRGPNIANKLPTVTPTARCKLRLLKQLRIKDHLLMEEEVVALYQARAKEKELKDGNKKEGGNREADDETLLASLKGSPLGVGTLEEVFLSLRILLTFRLLMMTMQL